MQWVHNGEDENTWQNADGNTRTARCAGTVKMQFPVASMGAAGRNRLSLCRDGMLSAGTSVQGQKRGHGRELFCA